MDILEECPYYDECEKIQDWQRGFDIDCSNCEIFELIKNQENE